MDTPSGLFKSVQGVSDMDLATNLKCLCFIGAHCNVTTKFLLPRVDFGCFSLNMDLFDIGPLSLMLA